jgi:membrane associated rhomboid family serine protease
MQKVSMLSMQPICTYCIIALTAAFSYQGLRNPSHEEKYIFDPRLILGGREYFRLVTSGFLHADWRHLGLNMISLFLFGPSLEFVMGREQFLLVYFGALIGGNLLSLFVHRHHEYRAYGASGAVCGVIFSYILIFPGAQISQLYLPIGVPAWLYAILFMLGSFYGMKNIRDNVGHDAHLGGAIIGFGITAALQPESIGANPKVFLIVLILSLALLIYLWKNPMFLPTRTFLPRLRRGSKRSNPPKPTPKVDVDAILEKISRDGYASLTETEKAQLREVSGKYRRREQSEKPKTGLTF